MCDVCKIADEIGEDKVRQIVEMVREQEEEHWGLIILSILYTLDVKNFKVNRAAAERAASDLDNGRVKLGEKISDDWQTFTFSAEFQDAKKEPEISDDNPIAKLFKELGLEF